MSNPSLPAPSPDAPKSTRDPTHTASSRSGRSDRLRIVRNLLIATENNRAASENMALAAERTTEAAQEVARVTDDADWTEDNAILGAPEGSPRCEGEFTTPRFLKPDNVPVPVSESHRVRNSLSVFGILERLVLVVSAAAITAFIIVATSPGSWNLWTNQRTADTSSANSQFLVQAVESATMPAASPAPTPAAVDQTTASSSSIRQLDRDEVNMLVQRGEELLMTGDFAAARLMLQRAAEAGDPHASLVLGATYDPIELEHLGVRGRGIFPSIAIARTWYEKAEQFGSAEARRRLELLAKRDP
jgi:hypothetical protein